jgi:hypothetical protein
MEVSSGIQLIILTLGTSSLSELLGWVCHVTCCVYNSSHIDHKAFKFVFYEVPCFRIMYLQLRGSGGLAVACWPLVPKFADSNPAEAVGFLRAKKKILTMPSFGGEVKPSVTCRRFAACKRSLNGLEVVISAKLPDNILAHSSTFRRWDLSRRGGRGGTWWWKWERLNAGESNGKPPLRIFPGCSVPEPYQSPDWALVSDLTGPRAEYR